MNFISLISKAFARQLHLGTNLPSKILSKSPSESVPTLASNWRSLTSIRRLATSAADVPAEPTQKTLFV